MRQRTSKKLATGIVLVLFLAVPALAERAPREIESREFTSSKVLRVLKRVLGISTTGDFPTVPKP